MLTLRLMEEEEIRSLHALQMSRDFPPSELKSVNAILNLRRRGEYDVIAVYEKEQFVAYALVFRPSGEPIMLLDYLAVEPKERRRGLGRTLLETLREYYNANADCLMIECERPKTAPDEAEARRRIRFYQRAGAELTNVRIWLFDVEYSILMLPCSKNMDSKQDWAERMLELYRRMLPEDLFARNVRLIRG